MSVMHWRWVVAVALTVSCSSPAEDGSEPATATERATLTSPVREVTCTAEATSRHVQMHLRFSADGKIHEGTASRGYGQAADDAIVRFDSVKDEGTRLAIEATETTRHYRFSIDKSVFAAKTHADVDARIVDTDDPAITEAVQPFSCSLGDAMGGFAIDGADASRLFDSLQVEAEQLADGHRVKVVDTQGGFRLHCNASAAGTVCSLRIPALVTNVAKGLVTYGYELDEAEAKALSAALGEGVATTAIHDVWNDELAAGAKMALKCSSGSCSATYTIPDRFYEFVP